MEKKQDKVALLLSGCGVFDGSEIHETVLSLLALSKHGLAYEIVAPNKTQYHVINHLTGDEITQTRNVLQESARLARGEIKDLQEVRVEDYQALIVPGGFGAAKNLCDFAIKQSSEFTVSPEINQFIKAFKTANKPVAMMCISPVIAAAIYGKDAKVTVGNDKVTAAVIEEKGAKHCQTSAMDICVDEKNKLITTPAYMLGQSVYEISQGIDKLVIAVIDMIKTTETV